MKRKRYKPFPFSKIKMSDPYAGTVTVRNILNHIISPKIVSDGNGGYTTRVDLVNIDSIVAGSVSVGGSAASSDLAGVFTIEDGTTITEASGVFKFTIPVEGLAEEDYIAFVQATGSTAVNDPAAYSVIIPMIVSDGIEVFMTVSAADLRAADVEFNWFAKRILA
jgi:hypothetical protein